MLWRKKVFLACKNNAQEAEFQKSKSDFIADNKAEMPEEHLDRSLSRLQSLYNFVITVQLSAQTILRYFIPSNTKVAEAYILGLKWAVRDLRSFLHIIYFRIISACGISHLWYLLPLSYIHKRRHVDHEAYSPVSLALRPSNAPSLKYEAN